MVWDYGNGGAAEQLGREEGEKRDKREAAADPDSGPTVRLSSGRERRGARGAGGGAAV